jgi:hypothetical protein
LPEDEALEGDSVDDDVDAGLSSLLPCDDAGELGISSSSFFAE